MEQIKKLDLTPRSPELLARAYDLAKRVCDLEPWKSMEERQVLLIELKDGRKRVLSVMGELGEHLAIALYPSKAVFERLNLANGDDIRDMEDAMFGVNYLQLEFKPAKLLLEGERQDIRASGVKFKRGVNPSFVTYVAGFAPARMGGEEMAETLDVIEAFLAFIEKFGAQSIPVMVHTSQLLTTWIEDDSGTWTKGENDYSGRLPVWVRLDEDLISRVAALTVMKGMTLEVGAFVVPAGRGIDNRGKISRLVMIVEAESHFIMDAKIVAAPDDAEFDWTGAVDAVLNVMLKFGHRPEELAVLGHSLIGVLKNVTKNYFPGTKFLNGSPCEAVREAFESMSEQLGL